MKRIRTGWNDPDWINANEAAEYLGVDKKTLKNYSTKQKYVEKLNLVTPLLETVKRFGIRYYKKSQIKYLKSIYTLLDD